MTVGYDTIPTEAIDDASAWTADDLADPSSFTFRWEDRHIDALDAAYAAYREYAEMGNTGLGLHHWHFVMPEISHDLHELYREVVDGRGIVRMAGLPIGGWSDEKIEAVYHGIGIHFGLPYPQSNVGDLVGRVENLHGAGAASRGYKSNRGLPMHTDPNDLLGMLCVRPATTGGDSLYVSATAIHDTIVRERPDVLPVLYRGFRLHRFDGKLPNGEEVTRGRIPIYSYRDGKLTCLHLPSFIHLAAEALGEPLSAAECEAIDVFEEIAQRPDLLLHVPGSPGDIVFVSNRTVMHTRTPFEDTGPPGSGRLFLRLVLLAFPGTGRPLVDDIARWIDRVDYARTAHPDYAEGDTSLKGDTLENIERRDAELAKRI